jgi:glucan phosphoethanolaminetransferase (alkaline phosphatase superfamily)
MISAAHLHLIINHVPLLGMIFGAVLLAFYFFRPNLKPILLVALVTILLSGLFGVPSFYSGESAEDLVENQAHVSETFMHEHEEAAEVTIWVLGLAGLLSFLSLLSLYLKKELIAKRLTLVTLIFSLAAIGLTAQTANLGGKISHPELRDSNIKNQQPIDNEKNEKDDD